MQWPGYVSDSETQDEIAIEFIIKYRLFTLIHITK